MRYFLLLALLIFTLTSYTQEIESYSFDLYIDYSCDNKIIKSSDYQFRQFDIDSIYAYRPDSNGTCILQEKGLYILEIYSPKGVINKVLEINSNRIDTLVIPPIHRSYNTNYIGPAHYFYVTCLELCQGKYEIYRETGVLWQKGRFHEGQLSKLITYNENEQIESKRKDGLIKDVIAEYDESGNLVMYLRFFLFYSKVQVYNSNINEYVTGRFFGHY